MHSYSDDVMYDIAFGHTLRLTLLTIILYRQCHVVFSTGIFLIAVTGYSKMLLINATSTSLTSCQLKLCRKLDIVCGSNTDFIILCGLFCAFLVARAFFLFSCIILKELESFQFLAYY